MRIDFAGIELNSGVPDDFGALWYVTDFSGWDGPAQRLTTTTSTSLPGSFLVSNIPDAREITLGGICKTHGGETGLWAAYNYFMGVTSRMETVRSLVVWEPVPKSLGVIRSGPPRAEIGPGYFTWEVSLLATDPMKRSLASRSVELPASTNYVEVAIDGNYNTPVTLVSNAAPSYPTQTLRIAVSTSDSTERYFNIVGIPSGTVIDSKTRTVKNGTTNYYSAVVPNNDTFPYLEPFVVNRVRNYSSVPFTMYFNEVWV